jgi:tetratricopeptide (TPR) repeat protein
MKKRIYFNVMEKFELPHTNIHKSEEEVGISRRDFLEGAALATATAILYPDRLADYTGYEKKSIRENFDTEFIEDTINEKPFSKTFVQKIFSDSPSQNFFIKWCEINDSIVPRFVSRNEWLQKNNDFSEVDDAGKKILYLPEDLSLWEMISFIKKVDHDTFEKKPELRDQKAKEIVTLGETFEKAGIYLLQYLPVVHDGKNIAQKIGEEFQAYGISLQKEKQTKDGHARNVVLSDTEKMAVDKWFLGEEVYQKRMVKLGNNPNSEAVEQLRKKILQAYFAALARKGYEENGKDPWETKNGPYKRLHDQTKERIIKAIKTPERELYGTIFKRGIEFLKNGMGFNKLDEVLTELENKEKKDENLMTANDKRNLESLKKLKPSIDFWKKQKYETLYEALEMPRLKSELSEIRKIGDKKQISLRELEIAKKIQNTISSFPYREGAEKNNSSDTPSGIIKSQYINCVGASMLGGALLDELGIKYLHADMPEHATTLLITSDGNIYWQDFLKSIFNFIKIENKYLVANKSAYSKTTQGILDYYNKNTNNSLNIDIKGWIRNGRQVSIDVSRRDVGLQYDVLNNVGIVLMKLGKNREAIEAFKQALDISATDASCYISLGSALSNIGRKEEAIAAYKKFIELWEGDTKLVDRAKRIIIKNQIK